MSAKDLTAEAQRAQRGGLRGRLLRPEMPLGQTCRLLDKVSLYKRNIRRLGHTGDRRRLRYWHRQLREVAKCAYYGCKRTDVFDYCFGDPENGDAVIHLCSPHARLQGFCRRCAAFAIFLDEGLCHECWSDDLHDGLEDEE